MYCVCSFQSLKVLISALYNTFCYILAISMRFVLEYHLQNISIWLQACSQINTFGVRVAAQIRKLALCICHINQKISSAPFACAEVSERIVK